MSQTPWADTRQTYKRLTRQIADWLVHTADSLKYARHSTEMGPRRSKYGHKKSGRKNKQPSGAKGPKSGRQTKVDGEILYFSAQDFVSYATFIAGTDPKRIDVKIIEAIDLAVELRCEVSEHWKKLQNHKPSSADFTHQYFIKKLQEARHTLASGLPKISQVVRYDASAHGNTIAHIRGLELLSMNDEIETGAASINDSWLPEHLQQATAIPHRRLIQVIEDDPEVDSGEDQSLFFAIHCLFYDLNLIRQHITEIWKEYSSRETLLETVSAVTNTALDFVQKLEKDFLSAYPRFKNIEECQNFAFQAACKAEGENPLHRSRPGRSAADPNFAAYNLKMAPIGEALYIAPLATLSSLREVFRPNILPVHKKGHFGTYDATAKRSQMSLAQKHAEDRIILAECFTHFCIVAVYERPLPGLDEITRQFATFYNTKKIGLCLIFGSQIFLDIHHILRERVSIGRCDLQRFARAHLKILDQADLHNYHHPNWPPGNRTGVKQSIEVLHDCILGDFIAKKLASLMKTSLFNDNNIIEPYYLLDNHPWFCGTMLLAQRLSLHDTCEVFACNTGCVLPIVHLHHALRTSGHLDIEWKTVTSFVQLYGSHNLFAGSPPTNLRASLWSLSLMYGYNAVPGSVHNATPRYSGLSAPPDWPSHKSLLLESLSKRYLYYERDGTNAENIERIVQESLFTSASGYKQRSTSHGAATENTHKSDQALPSRQSSHKLTIVQILQALKPLIQDNKGLKFNYVGWVHSCQVLLRKLHKALQRSLVYHFGAPYAENESQITFVVQSILAIAAQSEQAQERGTRDSSGIIPRGSILQIAAEIMREHIEDSQ